MVLGGTPRLSAASLLLRVSKTDSVAMAFPFFFRRASA